MDTRAAFALGEINRGKSMKVFDWNKAAKILKLRGIEDASAGLESDLEWTAGDILRNGMPISDEAYLVSTWATPLLIIDGEEIPCWIDEKEATWNIKDANKEWPESALKILEGQE
jgi:hypothetical protein